MKIEVKVDAACEETTVVICTDKVTDEIQQLVRKLSQDAPQVIVGFLEDEAVILTQEEIVRVFAEGGKVFAETSGGQFLLRLRLYELEERLDGKHFVRISNAEIIKNVCVPLKKPVVAGEEGICSGCGVATLSISYYDLGYETGEMAYDILVNGKDPGDMEVQFAPKFTKEYNADICKELGITPPSDYQAIKTAS